MRAVLMVARSLIGAVLCWSLPSWAVAVTIDATTTAFGSTSTSQSHTVAADANLMMICTGGRDIGGAVQPAVSATVGGSAATFLAGHQDPLNRMRVDVWYYLDPPSGAQTVATTSHATTDTSVTGAITLRGVAQSGTFNTPSSAGGTGTNADVDGIVSAVGELVLLCGAARTNVVTASADATAPTSSEQWEAAHSGGTSNIVFGYTEDGAAATIDMRVDLSASEEWAAVAVSIRPLAGRQRGMVILP